METECPLCLDPKNAMWKVKFHTCWRGQYQRMPFLLIGRRFKCTRTHIFIEKQFGRAKEMKLIYSGVFSFYTGLTKSPQQYMRYTPDEQDNTKEIGPARYSFNIFSEIFGNMELIKEEK